MDIRTLFNVYLEEHCLQKQLGLQEDEFGILRCHGWYANGDISEETKYPNYYSVEIILLNF